MYSRYQSYFEKNAEEVAKFASPGTSVAQRTLLICFLTISEYRNLLFNPDVDPVRDIPEAFMNDVMLRDFNRIISNLQNYNGIEQRGIREAGFTMEAALRNLYLALVPFAKKSSLEALRSRFDALMDCRNSLQQAEILLESVSEVRHELERMGIGHDVPDVSFPTKHERPKKHADSKSSSGIEPPENKSPETPGGDSPDEVFFTAFYPKEAKVETWHTLLVYAHLLSALAKVREDAKRYRDQIPAPNEATAKAFMKILRGAELEIVPTCEGIAFNPPSVRFKWLEEFHRADFRFIADRSLSDHTVEVQIDIYASLAIIGSLNFVMSFNDKDISQTSDAEEHANMYSKDDVFISYSRKDIEVVRHCKDVLEGFGLDVFLDLEDIKPGQLWEDEIRRRIERAKIFEIFWSANYSRSKNCRQEWEHALKQNRGVGYIRPMFWKKPLDPKPPRKLQDYNFKYVQLILPGG